MKHFQYFLLLSLFFLSSCKKEDQGDGNCKVTSIRTAMNSQFFNIGTVNYDENGNVGGMTFSSDTLYSNFSIKYLKDSIKIFAKKPGNFFYLLDAQGRVTKLTTYQSNSISYNADGYIESIVQSKYDFLKFSYIDGNLVKIITESIQPNDSKTTYTFTYNMNEKAVDLITATNPLYYCFAAGVMLPSARYFGNTSKNQLKSVEIVSENGYSPIKGITTQELTYTEEAKKITSVRIIDNSFGEIRDKLFEFKYECK